MLVLSRKVGEKIRIGESIVVTLLKSDSHKARIGVEAPRDVPVYRQEVFEFMRAGRRRENPPGDNWMNPRRTDRRQPSLAGSSL